MSVLIKGIEMPKDGTYICIIAEGTMWLFDSVTKIRQGEIYEIPTPHGRLIDADELENEMYRKSFETDDNRQKWDSGLWIRYKIFEESINNTPTIIESEDN